MLSKQNKTKLGIFLLICGLLLTFSTLISRSLFNFLFPPKLAFKNYQVKETKPEDKYPVRIKILHRTVRDEVKNLDLDLAVVPQKIIAKQWPVASDSANYLVGSGVPGERGNIVIYGHALNNIFGPILNIQNNDEIILETKDKKIYKYKVGEIKVVWPLNKEVIEPTNEEILTVYTCYGLFDTQRFVVVAKPAVSKREMGEVKRVIDGDTIELTDGRRVRYIGINTPEMSDPRKKVECFGREAKEKNKELVEGKIVELEKDISEKDIYGRYLRYVYVNGIFINEYLVEQGFANTMTIPPDVKYQKLFLEKEKQAREEKRGLWGKCKI